MSVSEPFIRRPIATSLLGIALLIGGALGYWALPVSALPQVDFPTVQVTTQLPGASPDVIASLITAPLERQLGQIPSLSSMTSTSSFGVSQISLQFDLNRDIDGATQDVQAAINAAAGVLPRNLPYPPTYAKVNPADAPVLTLALTSETISLRTMSDLADTILAQRLSQISGVGRVSVLGGLKPAVRVQADLARLAAYGIAMEDLRNAIAGANVSGPKGSLDGRGLQAYHHCLPQRRTGHYRRRRRHRRWAGERSHRRLVPGHAGGHHRYPAAARRQRHRSRPPDPRGNSKSAARDPGRREPDRGQRPHGHHSRLRQ
jgi:multidrug efflux pump